MRHACVALAIEIVNRAAGTEVKVRGQLGQNDGADDGDDDADSFLGGDDSDDDDDDFDEDDEGEAAKAKQAEADAKKKRKRKGRKGGEGDNSNDEDASAAAEEQLAQASRSELSVRTERIVNALGQQGRDNLMAALYTLRADTSAVVRQAAHHAWKAAILHTPQLLYDVLPVLISRLVKSLAGDDEEARYMAGSALGELVRKMGDSILPQVVPILRDRLRSPSEVVRRGACEGLQQVLQAASRLQTSKFLEPIASALRVGLCDESSFVRRVAAFAFNQLQARVGVRAVEAVVPELLRELDESSRGGSAGDDGSPAEPSPELAERGARAMEGLRSILSVRAKELLPLLLPKLLRPPLGAFEMRALQAVASASGDVLHFYFSNLLPAIVRCLACEDYAGGPKYEEDALDVSAGSSALNAQASSQAAQPPKAPASGAGADVGPPAVPGRGGKGSKASAARDEPTQREVSSKLSGPVGAAAARLVSSVSEAGVAWLLEGIMRFVQSQSHRRRRVACWLAARFCEGSACDISPHTGLLLKDAISLMSDKDTNVTEAATDLLDCIVKNRTAEGLVQQAPFIRDNLRNVASTFKHRARAEERRALLSAAPKGGAAGGGGSAGAEGASASEGQDVLDDAEQIELDKYSLPGLKSPAAIQPFSAVYHFGCIQGRPEIQEVCARGLGELIEFAPRQALDKRLLKLGGPLIRMLGPALVPRTRHAVVEALFVVLRRGQDAVKALFSQMQTTFTSSLTDDNRVLRALGASAIAHLARVSPRVDPIARQLAEGARTQSGAIKEA